MLSRRWLPLLFALTANLACTGSPTTDSGDVTTDAVDETDGSTDADAEPLPPGPRGQILGIPLTENESWTIPTLHAPVQVVRTEASVPHIYASNERDATVVWGFVTARDRYTQIELSRRLGRGIISQLLGDAGLAADQGARDRGYTYVAQRLIAQMSATELDLLDAYAEGINAYIDAVQHYALPVPTELGPVGLLLGTTHPAMLMQPVAREDIASVLAVVLFNSSYADDDLLRARVAEAFPTLFNGLPDETLRHDGVVQDVFNRVQPLTTMTSAAGFGVEGGTLMTRSSRTRRRTRTRTPRMPNDVLDRAIASNEFFTRLRRGMRDADFGSNAWATAGRANADGHAIVSGDGHLPLSVPTLLHQVAIDTSIFGDGTDPQTFIGLAFPGIPLLPLGTNGEVAYSFTYLYGDQTDWYSEEIQLDSMGRPAASRFGGTWHPLVATNETYTIANVPSLMSVGRTEMWTHWTTFDGRWIASIEGRPAMRTDTPGAGESIIEIQGNLIIPADVNGDGHISAVSSGSPFESRAIVKPPKRLPSRSSRGSAAAPHARSIVAALPVRAAMRLLRHGVAV
jgi:acyl-homoserine lactone acylase PvdQ